MSLIAAYNAMGVPCLIGDILVSLIGDQVAPHVKLPTGEDVNAILPPEWHRRIVSTCQKVYIISDNFSVAWCDSHIVAKSLITELFRRFGNGHPSLSEIQTFLQSCSGYENPNCTLLGWICHQSELTYFIWDSCAPNLFRVDQEWVAGSGSHRFLRIFKPQFMAGSSADPIQLALQPICNLLGNEVLYGRNLEDLFGGGVQIVARLNGAFVQIPSTTFLFLPVKETHNGIEFLLQKRILKYHFEDEILNILSLTFPSGRVGTPKMHYVFPINPRADKGYIVNSGLSLESAYYCIFVDIQCKDDLRSQLCFTVAHSPDNPLIKIVKDTKGTFQDVALGSTLFDSIARYLKHLDRTKARRSAIDCSNGARCSVDDGSN